MKNYFSKIDAKQQYKLAVEELNRGRINNAFELLDRAIEKYENHIESLTLRGNLYAGINKWDKTLLDFEKLNVIQPKTKNIKLIIGNCHYHMRNYNESIKFLTEHILIEPKYPVAYVNRANSYKNINKFEKALIDINEAIRITPRNIDSYLLRAEIQEELNQLKEVESSYDKAIELEIQNGTSCISFVYKIEFLKRNGQVDKAIILINKKIEENPYERELYYKRAQLFYLNKDYKLAKSDYKIAIQYGVMEARTEIKNIA